MRVALIFIDGLGLGDDQPEKNPLAAGKDIFAELIGFPMTKSNIGQGIRLPGLAVIPIDAILGVDGLPQSATGQTSLFSGVNAQQAIGRHLNGFPSPRLRQILEEKGIFKRLAGSGLRAVFANAFTEEYFEAVRNGKWRYSASTVGAMAGDQPLRGVEDLANGEAVYQDITRTLLLERGYGDRIGLTSPEAAGRDLAHIIGTNDFTLYEYFQTDRCGHKQDPEWAERILADLSCFIRAVLANLDPKECAVLICSDHGNIEALDIKTHTLNPVTLVAWGKESDKAMGVKDLTEVVPLILEMLGINNEKRMTTIENEGHEEA